MITSCVFFLSFWDFSVSISFSDAILYGFSLNYVSVDWVLKIVESINYKGWEQFLRTN